MINLSLVGTAPSSILQDAVDYATAHDVVVVAAAGNYGTDAPVYPAASNGAVARGGDQRVRRAPGFSNYGAWMSFAAPGVDVVTTTIGGGYATSTGTSPAAAVRLRRLRPAPRRQSDDVAQRRDRARRRPAPPISAATAGIPTSAGGASTPTRRWCRARSARRRRTTHRPTVSILSPSQGQPGVGHGADRRRRQRQRRHRARRAASSTTAGTRRDRAALLVRRRRLARSRAGRHKLRAYAYDTSNNVAKTKKLKVSFTPGTGLLVTHTVVKASSVSINGALRPPGRRRFDPSRRRGRRDPHHGRRHHPLGHRQGGLVRRQRERQDAGHHRAQRTEHRRRYG